MKLDLEKYRLACARACMGQSELVAAGVPRGTLCRATGKGNISPKTAGRIAKALNVDVSEIIEQPERK